MNIAFGRVCVRVSLGMFQVPDLVAVTSWRKEGREENCLYGFTTLNNIRRIRAGEKELREIRGGGGSKSKRGLTSRSVSFLIEDGGY